MLGELGDEERFSYDMGWSCCFSLFCSISAFFLFSKHHFLVVLCSSCYFFHYIYTYICRQVSGVKMTRFFMVHPPLITTWNITVRCCKMSRTAYDITEARLEQESE